MTTIRDSYILLRFIDTTPANHSASCLLAVNKCHQAIALRYPEVMIQQQKRLCLDAAKLKETWMEIYAGVAQRQLENLKADLLDLAETHGLPRERKYEVFINL